MKYDEKVLIASLGLSVLFLITSAVGAQGWYDLDWPYRIPVAISSPCEAEVTDYQVQVTLDNSFDFSHAVSDGSDLRVTDSDGKTPIPFRTEEWDTDTTGSERASIWVKVPCDEVPALSIRAAPFFLCLILIFRFRLPPL